jgi:serine/threonine protein kinase
MLKAFSNHQQRHLIKLLATFSYQGQFHLIFPLARYNLRTYWKETPTPVFSTTHIRWMLSQCRGITTGLNAIHNYRTSTTRQQPGLDSKFLRPVTPSAPSAPSQNSNFLQPVTPSAPDVPNEKENLYGRHGDIKPENILWSDEDITRYLMRV